MTALEIVEGKQEGERAWDAVRRANNPAAWVEVDEAAADEALEVLPPIYFKGGFAVSEACDFDAESGAETYLCVVTRKGRYFARTCTIAQATADADLIRNAGAA